jgi:hypothetical protein
MAPVFNPVAFCVASVPFQPSEPVPPVAVQAVLLVADQVNVVESPGWMDEGEIVRVTFGALTAPTKTCCDPLPEPPGPVQVSP